MAQSPTDYKAQLGDALTRLRKAAGLRRADVAIALDCSVGKVGTIERGEVALRPYELNQVLDLFKLTGDERADLTHLANEARSRQPRTPWGSVLPERLRRMFQLEESAIEIRSYNPELIHGLFQTENYARAVLATNSALSDDQRERMVRARMARQSRLTSDDPPTIALLIGEAALRIRTGSASVMRAQLAHLVTMSRLPFVSIRVVPFEAGSHSATGFPFSLLTPPNGRATIAYLETRTDNVFVDDQGRVATYQTVFNEVCDIALTPAETRTAIDRVASEL